MTELQRRIFPLPLAPLEEYMLYDDRPAYPMSGVFRMRFEGYLEQNAFEKSVRAVMGRHPLLRATVAPARRGWRWIDNPGWIPTVQWQGQAKSNAYGFPNTGYLALTEQPGTRLWVVEQPQGHDVILQVHHACGDALGVAGVMEDFLVGYALAKGGKAGAASFRRLDPDRLLRRNSLPVSVLDAPTFASKQLVGLLGVREFFMHVPDPLLGSKSPPSNHLPPAEFPSPLTVEWDEHQTVRLQTAARAQGVSVGILLLRDLFMALDAWRREQRVGDGRSWLRIAVPMGLRSSVHRDMPMADAMSMVFLDRRRDHLKDPRRLMKSIRMQMLRIKSFRLQHTFVLSLKAVRLLPGGLSRWVCEDACQATTCLSNLGTVLGEAPLSRKSGRLVSGNVILESVDFVIPLRPHLQAALCTYTYGGRLRILLHHDNRVLSHGQARGLLGLYVNTLRETVSASFASGIPRLS